MNKKWVLFFLLVSSVSLFVLDELVTSPGYSVKIEVKIKFKEKKKLISRCIISMNAWYNALENIYVHDNR